jgi:hypothetical protein
VPTKPSSSTGRRCPLVSDIRASYQDKYRDIGRHIPKCFLLVSYEVKLRKLRVARRRRSKSRLVRTGGVAGALPTALVGGLASGGRRDAKIGVLAFLDHRR